MLIFLIFVQIRYFVAYVLYLFYVCGGRGGDGCRNEIMKKGFIGGLRQFVLGNLPVNNEQEK